MIDKLMPFQAIIGIALLAFGILNLLRSFGTPSIFDIIKIAPHQLIIHDLEERR